MRTVPQRTLAFVVVLLLLAACATSTGFIVSGESLDAVGKSFVAVGQAYNRELDAQRISVDQYRSWSAFAKKFQAAYPSAVQLWKSSIAVNDAALTKKSDEIIVSLVTELAKFATVVGVQVLK
jgi:hypothetical protein